MKLNLIGAVLIVTAGMAAGQTNPASRPQFAVASIRLHSPDNEFASDLQVELAGGRLHARQILLRSFIEEAYGIRPFQLSGAPRWINSEGYDIEASAGRSVGEQEMLRMMRALLEDRFRLKARRETRDLSVWNLSAAKGGIKLPPAKVAVCIPGDSATRQPQPDRASYLPFPVDAPCNSPHRRGRECWGRRSSWRNWPGC